MRLFKQGMRQVNQTGAYGDGILENNNAIMLKFSSAFIMSHDHILHRFIVALVIASTT